MKKLSTVIFLFIFATSCEKTGMIFPYVDKFVLMLRKGTYDNMFIPAFKPEDIERLLYYAGDFSSIRSFPINPISSYMPRELRLGECLLWTIESIRLTYKEPDGFKRFPSLVPELIIPGGTIQQPVATITDLNRAWSLYNKWWTDNKASDFDEFRSVNPLEGAVLMWH